MELMSYYVGTYRHLIQEKGEEKRVGGVAEIANAYLNKYDKVSNPIPEKVLT